MMVSECVDEEEGERSSTSLAGWLIDWLSGMARLSWTWRDVGLRWRRWRDGGKEGGQLVSTLCIEAVAIEVTDMLARARAQQGRLQVE